MIYEQARKMEAQLRAHKQAAKAFHQAFSAVVSEKKYAPNPNHAEVRELEVYESLFENYGNQFEGGERALTMLRIRLPKDEKPMTDYKMNCADWELYALARELDEAQTA